MKRLGNLNYNLKMISDELNISPTQLNTYLDSYVTIPRRRLPENLGIDEIHSLMLAKRNSSYLYRRFNKTCSYENAVLVFDQYVDAFKNSGIRQYDEFVGILEHWKPEILNSFLRTPENWRLSNSRTENINGKIWTYLGISKDIGNFDRFRKRVIFALNPKIYYALTSNPKSVRNPHDNLDYHKNTVQADMLYTVSDVLSDYFTCSKTS